MLSRAVLQAAILRMLDPDSSSFLDYPKTYGDAAKNWANAYDQYARQATDVSTDPVVTVNTAGFMTTLAQAFATSTSAVELAEGFAKAFTLYWTGAVFAIGVPPTPEAVCPTVGGLPQWSEEVSSLVTAVNSAPLLAELSVEMSTLSANASQKASNLAGILHGATISGVIVTIEGFDVTPPPTGPIPNTNICTIF